MIEQSIQIQRLLNEAIAAARAGDNKYARPLLRRVVALDPNNEQAWLWLSQVEDTYQQRINALERVLEVNPQNTAAQRGLELLREKGEQAIPASRSARRAAGPSTAGQQNVAQPSAMEELRPMLEASRKRKGGIRTSEAVILVLGLLLVWLVARIAFDLIFPEVPDLPVAPESRLELRLPAAQAGPPALAERSTAMAAGITGAGLLAISFAAPAAHPARSVSVIGSDAGESPAIRSGS